MIREIEDHEGTVRKIVMVSEIPRSVAW